MTTRDYWQRLEKWLTQHGGAILQHLPGPAQATQLQALSELAGPTLDPEFILFYQKHDGFEMCDLNFSPLDLILTRLREQPLLNSQQQCLVPFSRMSEPDAFFINSVNGNIVYMDNKLNTERVVSATFTDWLDLHWTAISENMFELKKHPNTDRDFLKLDEAYWPIV